MSAILADVYIQPPAPDLELPEVKKVSNAGEARYHLLAWSSPARLDPRYAAAVVDKYIRTKLRRSRSRKYITEKLETLEKQLPDSATIDNAFATARRRYSLPPSPFRAALPPVEAPPVYSADDPLPEMTRTLLTWLSADEVMSPSPPYST